MSAKGWRCSTKWAWRASPEISTRSRPGSSTASWCARCRAASIRDALEHPLRVPSKELPPDTDLQRAPLLEAQVEIEIAAGDVDRARSAVDELKRVAARFESQALVA